jgi:hypothetical protein
VLQPHNCSKVSQSPEKSEKTPDAGLTPEGG